MKEQYISLSDLRQVKGIGDKTIERIKDYLEEQGRLKRFKSEFKPEKHMIMPGLYHGDCLDLMFGIPDKSIDMILCDLPYGTTACSWDEVIPFEPLWSHYKRIIKDNGAIVLFGSEPFSTKLRMSNLEWYKYDWIWKKSRPTNFVQANKMPLKYHETISVFYKNPPTFIKQYIRREGSGINRYKYKVDNSERKLHGTDKVLKGNVTTYDREYKNPSTVLEFTEGRPQDYLHPTQKPVELCEYLIKTYTNEGDIVLDNCIGSGTTAIAAINTNRKYIGMEMNDEYYNIAKDRINNHILEHNLQDTYSIIA